jgi:hypothetical protein
MSNFNKEVGAGIHYSFSEEKQREEFDASLRDMKELI